MNWRLLVFIASRHAGWSMVLGLVAACAVAILTFGVGVAQDRVPTHWCSLTVQGFTTVYGGPAVTESVEVYSGGKKGTTMYVVDTPGNAGVAMTKLPCGRYTLWAPRAPGDPQTVPVNVTLDVDQAINLQAETRKAHYLP